MNNNHGKALGEGRWKKIMKMQSFLLKNRDSMLIV